MPRIDGHTRLVGLIGYPVEHTRSPQMHNAAFEALGLNYCYVPLPVAPADVGAAIAGLAALGFVGVNVTIPHKQAVIPYLDELSAEAQAIGAVNTIVFASGRRIGYNTDGPGFLRALTDRGFSVAGKRALVLGAGGAARAVVYALAQAGGEATVVNRTEARAAALAAELRRYVPGPVQSGALDAEQIARLASAVDLVVNATSLGMGAHVGESPWPADVPFPSAAIAYDLVYAGAAGARPTAFLRQAEAVGAQTLDGSYMLVYQGALAFEKWTGQSAPIEVMMAALNREAPGAGCLELEAPG